MEINSDLYYAVPGERSGWITGREGDAYRHAYAGKDYNLQAQLMQWVNYSINLSNVAIESIEEGMVDDDPRKESQGDRIMGEAKFLRAFSNWMMTVMLGPQYHSSTLASNSAIYRDKPIISPTDVAAKVRTVSEMYNFIIADLVDAQAKLPEIYDNTLLEHPSTYLARVRKDAATALLAKVYFQMNDFDKALEQVNLLLGPVSASGSAKYPLAANYDNLFKILGGQNYSPNMGKELIYAAEGSSAQKWTLDSKWTYYRFTRPKTNAGGTAVPNAYGRLKLGNPYINLFDKVNDKRFLQWVEVVGGTNYWQKKLSTSNMNMPIFRSAEFHLMRAEILARKDNLTDAALELDLVRIRSGLTAFTVTTKEALINEIINERAREMVGESVRHLDNLRLGAIDGTLVPLGQKDADDKTDVGGVDQLPWDSPKLIYDMPTNEIIYNPGLYD
ncbi:MAG: RagB/SusD family nutrient uptake outer membrane protein [Bacteroidales bacterium]|nr:RagB/SusD family nutrient uptake outer membrane protein [Bacteroidales bacterium]